MAFKYYYYYEEKSNGANVWLMCDSHKSFPVSLNDGVLEEKKFVQNVS